MKQNKARITLFCVVGLVVLVVLLVVLLPSWRYAIFQKPIRTKKLIPKTDQIIGYYADEEILFSQKQAKALYGVLDDAIAHVSAVKTQSAMRWEEAKASLVCLELRYDFPHCYVGTAGHLEPYDVLRLQLCNDGIVILNGKQDGLLLIVEAEILASCEGILRAMIAERLPNPMGEARALQGGTEEAVSDLFAEPAQLHLAANGVAVSLSQEQQEQLYAAFAHLRDGQALPVTGPYGRSEAYTAKAVYQDMRANICLELCYDTPQRFDGVFAKVRQEGSEETTDLPLSATYDSVVLMLREDAVTVYLGRNGLYESVSDFYRTFSFGEGYVAFYGTVTSFLS